MLDALALATKRFVTGSVCLAILACLAPAAAASGDPFPEVRPSTRAEAIALLCGSADSPALCLRRNMHEGRSVPFGRSPAALRAVELLGRGIAFSEVEEWLTPTGLRIRYTTGSGAFDRLDPTDGDANGRPDVVDATVDGLESARHLMIGQLELPEPQVSGVLLVELGEAVDGYVVPARGRRGGTLLVLDATPSSGIAGARRAAVRQYAFAAATGLSPGFPSGWAEALALWTTVAIDGLDTDSAALLSRRIERLGSGLLVRDPVLEAGNAIWFSFLEQAYGLGAVRVTVEELSRPIPVQTALDRAVRRTSTDDLASAFREFHLWTVLTGERADSHHFSFSRNLAFPGFAASTDGLPALSVQREPPLAPLGATQIRLAPLAQRGGLRIHFEGDFSARWEIDLLLVGESGSLHRLPLSLTAEGRGEITVPVDAVREALLLTRCLDSDDGAAFRYTYSAQHEHLFPFELTTLDATVLDGTLGGVLVSWETASEQQLVGFNVLRRRTDGEAVETVNPVWVPALGSVTDEASYHFLDRSAEPGAGYTYRIQGITTSGVSSFSDAVTMSPGQRPGDRSE